MTSRSERDRGRYSAGATLRTRISVAPDCSSASAIASASAGWTNVRSSCMCTTTPSPMVSTRRSTSRHSGCLVYRLKMVLTHLNRFAAVAVVVAIAISQFALCSGWQGTARDRMLCCEGAAHECPPAEADECCAAGELTAHATAAASTAMLLHSASVTDGTFSDFALGSHRHPPAFAFAIVFSGPPLYRLTGSLRI